MIRLKDWLNKIRSIEQMKQFFQSKNISWLNYLQLERWTNEWVKKYNKGREFTKYEQFLLSFEDIQMMDSVKGTVSKIYGFLLNLEKEESDKEGVKLVCKQDLEKRINEEEWRKMWNMRVLRFMSVRIRGNCLLYTSPSPRD